jgi:phosphoribosylformylglycinamidine synthase
LCKDVYLSVERTDTDFTRSYTQGQAIRVPIAHHDGNYFADDALLERIEGNGQVAFRYCDAQGQVSDATNPNGSRNNIAGVFNEAGTVLGLMPHPERLADAQLGGTDGKLIFDSLVEALCK